MWKACITVPDGMTNNNNQYQSPPPELVDKDLHIKMLQEDNKKADAEVRELMQRNGRLMQTVDSQRKIIDHLQKQLHKLSVNLQKVANSKMRSITKDKKPFAPPDPITFTEWRRKKGISQQDIVKETGISSWHYTECEKGNSAFTAEMAYLICKAMKVDILWFSWNQDDYKEYWTATHEKRH